MYFMLLLLLLYTHSEFPPGMYRRRPVFVRARAINDGRT